MSKRSFARKLATIIALSFAIFALLASCYFLLDVMFGVALRW